MFLEKLKWMYKLTRTKSFVVLTDKESVVSIPLIDIEQIENSFIISAQAAVLMDFKQRLEGVIGEHEDAIKLLAHRQGSKQTSGKKKTSARKTRKPTKKSKS